MRSTTEFPVILLEDVWVLVTIEGGRPKITRDSTSPYVRSIVAALFRDSTFCVFVLSPIRGTNYRQEWYDEVEMGHC